MLYNENMGKKVSLSVSIVIPNWNGMELLKKHLPAVIKTAVGTRIIVVDDHSTDDSVSYLERNFPNIVLLLAPEFFSASFYSFAFISLNSVQHLVGIK